MSKPSSSLVLLPCLLLFAACGDDSTEVDPPAVKTEAISLTFKGVVADKDFSCESTYTLGTADTEVQFSDFKLFVHDVRLVREGGAEVPVTLDEDQKWQARGVALIDFEDAKGACANGTPELNAQLKGTAQTFDDIVGVRFKLGVPFELNHADVAALPSPLNLPSMFWSWQGGRKFFRIDGKAGTAGLRVHLGSVGCAGEEDAITSCAAPNRPEVELMGMNPTSNTIKIDIASFFETLDLTPADDKSVICMSAPETPACGPIFGAFGLPYGQQQAPAQSLFTVAP